MGQNANFIFWGNIDPDSRVKSLQQNASAEVVINNYKEHQNKDENAYIPVSAFDPKNVYIKDLNDDKKIDKDEVLAWLDKTDKMDGEDGNISSSSASGDYLDLLGFKSNQTDSLQKKITLRTTEEAIETLNKWADNSPVMFFVKEKIVNNMGKKESMDYILENESTKKLFAITSRKNNSLVKEILIKAYGETEALKKLNEL